MSDKAGRLYKVSISYVDGEVPLAAKFNAWSQQTSNALATIEKALGDLWDESYPYFESSDTLASSAVKNEEDGTEIGSDRKSEIANIVRLLGPSSALNPLHLSNLDDTERTVIEDVPDSVLFATHHSFVLKYKPDVNFTPTFSGTGTVFTSEVVSVQFLNAAGEYHINYQTGEVFSIDQMEGGTITYRADLGNDDTAYGTADYFNSSFNVIPDPNQLVKCSASGPDVDGNFTITLPTISDQISGDSGISSVLDNTDLNFGAQLKLPFVLQGLSTDDVIPGGFLFVRDDDTNQLYRSAVYLYDTESTLKVSGVTLDTSHGFSVITVGSTITQSIADLKLKLWRFRRAQDPHSVVDADQITDRMGVTTDEVYVPSQAPHNPFSQYLHRDGWFASHDDSNINDQNGMRGDLVLLAETRVGGTRSHLSERSRKIIWGSFASGPRSYYRPVTPLPSGGNYATLYFESTDLIDFNAEVNIEEFLYSGEGIYSGVNKGHPTDSNHGPLKWWIDDSVSFDTDATGLSTPVTIATVDLTTLGGTVLTVTGSFFHASVSASVWFSPGGGGAAAGLTDGPELRLHYDPSTGAISFKGNQAQWASLTGVAGRLVVLYI